MALSEEIAHYVRDFKCHASLKEAGVKNVGVWATAMMRHGTV